MDLLDHRAHGADLRGVARLLVQGTRAVTAVVEDMHRAVAPPLPAPIRRLVYAQVDGIAGLVGGCLDVALAQLTPVLRASPPGPERAALLAALNGVLGDHLEATANPLAIEMVTRAHGRTLSLDDPAALARAVPDASGHCLLLVHGACMSDTQWRRRGHDHGAALGARLGTPPIYVRYNSGRHVEANGADLAALLERLVTRWPVPIERITVVAYSMGGLVTRAGIRAAERAGLSWRARLDRVVFMGTPHHGAPLERAGNWLETLGGLNRYSAPIARVARVRSAGITDLRFGCLVAGAGDRFAPGVDRREPTPLPTDVDCYAIAGQLGRGRFADLGGDGLVPVSSALGRHPDAAHDLGLPDARIRVIQGAAHLDLLSDPRVFSALCGWLQAERDPQRMGFIRSRPSRS